MVQVSNNQFITMNAGDSLVLPIFINGGNTLGPARYILENDDKIYFSLIEPGRAFNDGLVRKILTKDDLNSFGDPILKLSPTDTEWVLPGTYYYELKLRIVRDNIEYVDTILPRRKFCII